MLLYTGSTPLLGPDSAPLPPAEALSLRPGEVLASSVVAHLSARILEDAIIHHRLNRRDFHLTPPVHLRPRRLVRRDRRVRRDVGGSAKRHLHQIAELHQLTCERSHHPTIFIPFLVDGQWLLAVIKPDSPSGHVLVLFSRRSRTRLLAVENELSSFLHNPDGSRPTDGGFGPPITSWHPYRNFSVQEEIGSRDSGVYLLLNLAATMLNLEVDPPVDTTKVRTLLAGLMAPQSSGAQFNFFDSSSAVAAPPDPPQNTEDDPPLACVSCRGAVDLRDGSCRSAADRSQNK